MKLSIRAYLNDILTDLQKIQRILVFPIFLKNIQISLELIFCKFIFFFILSPKMWMK